MNWRYHLLALHRLALGIGWAVIILGAIIGVGLGLQAIQPHLPPWAGFAALFGLLGLLLYACIYTAVAEVDEANSRLSDN